MAGRRGARRVLRASGPGPGSRVAFVAAFVASLIVLAPAGAPAGAQVAASSILDASPTGTGTDCTTFVPCSLGTALEVGSSGGGNVTIGLGAGTYEAGSGYGLALGTTGAGLTLVGSSAGSVLQGGGGGSILTLSGTGSVSVDSVTFEGGTTSGNGGAIEDVSGPALTVSGSSFVDDQATDGGGLYVSGGTALSVVGSTFEGDVATANGGAIDDVGATSTILGSTFVSDRGGSGGGVYGDAGTALEADVLGADPGGACAGPVTDTGYVVADDTSCPAGAGSQVVADSVLFPTGSPVLAKNGGPTETVELSVTGNPAYDAVPAGASVPSSSTPFCSTADGRGVPRLQPAGSTGCSPGAVQYAPPVVGRVAPPSGGPGTVVTVTGHGLGLATRVTLNGDSVPFEALSDTSLTLTVPPGTTPTVGGGPGPGAIVVADLDSRLSGSIGRGRFNVAGPLSIETTGVSYTETGATYFDHLVTTGGAGGDTWTATGLPARLGLSRAGELSGYPSTPGSFPVHVTVTDRTGEAVGASFDLTIGAGPTIVTSSLAPGRVGARYGARLVATGGRPPYRWSVASARSPIPGGLLLSSRGTLTGIPGTPVTTRTTLRVTDSAGGEATAELPIQVLPPPPPPEAYVIATAAGQVATYGAPPLPARSRRGPGRVVAVAAPPRGGGYWLVTSTGIVIGNGSSHSLGSIGRAHLDGSVVGIASLPSGNGYWIASSTGRVYGFGGARDIGTPRSRRIAERGLGPVVAITANPVGTGYWLLGATGRVASFGDATRYGSIPARLRVHAVGIAADATGTGYVVVSSAGRLYGFGRARPLGWATRPRPGQFVSVAAAGDGLGYWIVTTTGHVDPVGSARLLTPAGSPSLSGVVGIAATS